MNRLLSALLAFTLATALTATPARAADDQEATRPDTRLGNYEEAPYRGVVTFDTDALGRRIVEIPQEHVFNPDLLDRTVIIGGREWRDLIIVSRRWDQRSEGYEGGMRFYVHDLFEERRDDVQWLLDTLNANWAPDVSAEARQRAVDDAYYGAMRIAIKNRISASWDWPMSEEIVSINGRPWQETEWRDFIIDQTKTLLKPGDPVLANPDYWAAYLNPSYNGRARELLIEHAGESQQPVRHGATVTSHDQVVLTLGSSQVTRYRGGAVETVTLDAPVEAVAGVTMVPLRGILDHFGAQLTYWEGTISITDGATLVLLQVGQPTALVNGQTLSLARPAEIRNGRTLVPLRFIAEALGYQVTWDPATHQVTVRK